MERQIITVDISPHRGMVPQLRVSQGDIGRPLGVYIMQDGAALDCSNYSADLYILKSDGNYYVAPATVDSTETNLIIWSTEVQETPVAGECAGQIRIRHGEDDIGTARFVEYVEASPGFSGAGSESAVESIKEYVRQAAASAETASGAASSATGSASAASGSASAAASSASAAAGSASSAHTDAETASQAAQTAQDVADSIPEDYSTLSNDVSSLKSAFEQLNDNVIVDSAGPVPIVSIADGADGMPMRSVEVAIEPVQDLHGYDAPWPAGGRKNLIPTPYSSQAGTYNGVTVTVNDDGTLVLNGTATASVFFYLLNSSSAIPMTAGDYVLHKPIPTAVTGVNITVVKNGSYWASAVTTEPTLTLSEDANISWYINVASGTALSNVKVYPMFERGTTVSDWSPYSNVCPITGWTGAKVTRTGANLFDKNQYENLRTDYDYYMDSYYCKKIQLKPNTVYSVKNVAENTSDVVLLLNKDQKVNSTGYFDFRRTEHFRTYTTDDTGCLYIGVLSNYSDAQANARLAECNISIELGSTSSDYEPYQGQTYEVTFPSETGTVYGGTLDVVTGKLVVDRAIIDLGTLTWALTDADNHVFRTQDLSQHKLTTLINYICSVYMSVNASVGATAMPDKSCKGNPTQRTYFYIKDSGYSDTTTFRAALSGVMLCYELVSQQEITLSPTEIKTLLGINNIWADTGSIAITYPADTKMYIDRKITEAVANALNA